MRNGTISHGECGGGGGGTDGAYPDIKKVLWASEASIIFTLYYSQWRCYFIMKYTVWGIKTTKRYKGFSRIVVIPTNLGGSIPFYLATQPQDPFLVYLCQHAFCQRWSDIIPFKILSEIKLKKTWQHLFKTIKKLKKLMKYKQKQTSNKILPKWKN